MSNNTPLHNVGEGPGLPTSETRSPPPRDGMVPRRLLAHLERGFRDRSICIKCNLIANCGLIMSCPTPPAAVTEVNELEWRIETSVKAD
ncbi:hypothetical protein QQF64_022378 [Cirrhinus molitorella]|uniref:Uncharacterized protein n=1 Tax=Cirrhinus molitorella TaxID=172907 RepID=A0ABR3L9J4_9TELE